MAKKISTIAECVAELETEIKFRHGVYSKKVHRGEMTAAEKDEAIQLVKDSIFYLQFLSRIFEGAKVAVADNFQSKLSL